jgi:hypothetical protein
MGFPWTEPLRAIFSLPFLRSSGSNISHFYRQKFTLTKSLPCSLLFFSGLSFAINFGKKRSTHGRSPLFGTNSSKNTRKIAIFLTSWNPSCHFPAVFLQVLLESQY